MSIVKLVDLKRQYTSMQGAIDKAVKTVIDSQRFVSGEQVSKFESEFAKYCGGGYGVGVGSGSDGLFVALKALGCKAGDEVIVPNFTFIATAEAAILCGARVVFADVDAETGLINVDDVERKITKKTKFVIPVHLFGQVVAMKELGRVAKKRGIEVIEDAAQAHGARYFGKRVPMGKVGVFSFFPSKNLGGYGDAGMVVTKSKRLYEKMLMFRNHGRKKGDKYRHFSSGLNYRMDELQAAVLRVKLKYLNKWNKKRQKVAEWYQKELRGIEGVELIERVNGVEEVNHLMVIRVKKRNGLREYLRNHEVETGIHYPIPLHLQPVYKELGYKRGDFPGSEELAKKVLSLPMFAELTKEEVVGVSGLVREFYKG